MIRYRFWVCLVPLLSVLAVASCTPKEQWGIRPPKKQVGYLKVLGSKGGYGSGAGTQISIFNDGFQFEFVDQPACQGATRKPPSVTGQALSASRTQQLLQRLPPLESQKEDRRSFAQREMTKPPPLSTAVVDAPFPPPEMIAPRSFNAEPAPLKVLRHAPDGNIPQAANLSLTFSQPMVAVTSVTNLKAEELPVRLTPQVAGQWRWAGTYTLLFKPDKRFPMATRFEAEVPAGTRAASGALLDSPVRWTFATPPPQLVSSYPERGPVERQPLLYLSFDQAILARDVVSALTLTSGHSTVAVREATLEEIRSDPTVTRLVSADRPGQWVVLKPASLLPPDSTITVTVGKGMRSAEGPLNTPQDQSFTFQTCGPMQVVENNSGSSRHHPVSPDTEWSIRFTNPIRAADFKSDMVTVTPPLELMECRVNGDELTITGHPKELTTYRVRLSPSLTDIFGQRLGKTDALVYRVTKVWPSTPRYRASLSSEGGRLIVLDASNPPEFPVSSTNVDSLLVRMFRVGPEHFGPFKTYLTPKEPDTRPEDPPGELAWKGNVALESRPDERVVTRIDLSPALKNGVGNVVLNVKAGPNVVGTEDVLVWIEVTRIGLTAFSDQTDLVVWATSLKDGHPLEGVKTSLFGDVSSGVSDANGVARIPLPSQPMDLLVAQLEGDVALLPENFFRRVGDSGDWYRRVEPDQVRWFVFDGRELYRPGEEVKIKGWLRRLEKGKGGDLRPLGMPGSIRWKLSDRQDQDVASGTAPIGPLGGFDLSIPLPNTINLGYCRLKLTFDGGPDLPSSEWLRRFQVQEFRRPEFAVSTTVSQGPYVVGDVADLTATASYFSGGALANAEVDWRLEALPASFTPPNRRDFVFGAWSPWWEDNYSHHVSRSEGHSHGNTDCQGKHDIHVAFESISPPRTMGLWAQATVIDVNHQTWSASSTLLVHPSSLYVGLKTERLFVRQDEPLSIAMIVSDVEGILVPGRPVQVSASRLEWKQEHGTWNRQAELVHECSLTSSEEPVPCVFTPAAGGTYRIRATVKDDRERVNQTELTLWVSRGQQVPSHELKLDKLLLIPDKETYQPGETAELLVFSPFAPAEGLLTLRRSGLLEVQHFQMQGTSESLKIPVQSAHIPNLYAQVDLVGEAPRLDAEGLPDSSLPSRPAYASGSVELRIPLDERTLALKVKSEATELEPGGTTRLHMQINDSAGKPVSGAELAVVVVDEAVLALTRYATPNLISSFYSSRSEGVRDYDLRKYVLRVFRSTPELPDSESMDLYMQVLGDEFVEPVKAARSEGSSIPWFRLRSDFNALALFAPSVRTDLQGLASLEVKVPDNLTRYRVMVMAADTTNRFGSAETTLTARLPIMIRPSPPRFLNYGDSFSLPVVIQNHTSSTLPVDVVVRAVNARLVEPGGRRLTIAPHARAEVLFPFTTDRAGTARFQVGAVSGRFSDAAAFSIPVWTPVTTESFATYGQFDQGNLVQPIARPSDVRPEFGGLEITTSSTALQALTDAMLYLVSYPYECAEQMSSRVMGIVALQDVLGAFQAEGLPSSDILKASVDRDIERLSKLQNPDGGFGFWNRREGSWPFVSIHVANALARANEKGHAVKPDVLEKSLDYLWKIEKHLPRDYPLEVRQVLVAYALNVRARLDDKDVRRARSLYAELDPLNPPLEAVGWLLSVLSSSPSSQVEVEAIRQLLRNRVDETAGAAHFTTRYSACAHFLLYSDRRVDGILLEAMIQDQPESDLIPKLVAGMLKHRTQGRWLNTQENVFILLALDRYFATFEKAEPNFVARAWLGDRYVGGHGFQGRTSEQYRISVPMSELDEQQGPESLVLGKEGEGRLYYRLGMRYAPSSLSVPALDQGFTVERTYLPVDNPGDVSRDAEGVWHVKAGSRVRVQVTLVAPSRRYHVALVDPLPAGLETVNGALRGNQRMPSRLASDGGSTTIDWTAEFLWSQPLFFEHENLRDERAEAFTSSLSEGVYTYSYVARATTVGRFVVPPPKAEEMYSPEIFGRGSSDWMVVE